MSDFQELLSYGAAGVATFIVLKLALPLLNSVISRANVENAVYGNAKDTIDDLRKQIEVLQRRYDSLEKELRTERDRCWDLRRRLEELTDGKD